MVLLIDFLLFALGISVGSFLDVLIDRIPRGESVIKGRSHCDACHHQLAWFDLLPLFSFLSLRGKCRYCHKKIGWQNFIVQITTGLLFVFSFFHLPIEQNADLKFFITFPYILFFLSCFIVITVIDIKHGIIPDTIVYPAIGIAAIYHLFFISTFPSYFISALCSGLFFFLLFIVTKGRGMGFGDVKFAFLLGLFLGFPGIVIALYIAFLTGAMIAFILVLSGKKKFSKGTIAFGPFLTAGGGLAYFYGDFLWKYILFYFFRL